MAAGIIGTKFLALFIIYIGTWFYTFASFYHLKFKTWSFTYAYILAIPLVLCEYVFNIWGNKLANVVGLGPMQIMVCIIAFYLLNIWIFNLVILKKGLGGGGGKEILAICCIGGAVALSSNMHIKG